MSKKGIALYFDDELLEVLNKYRISMGWTWQRFFLYGVASTIERDSSNSDVLVMIAEYLEKKR